MITANEYRTVLRTEVLISSSWTGTQNLVISLPFDLDYNFPLAWIYCSSLYNCRRNIKCHFNTGHRCIWATNTEGFRSFPSPQCDSIILSGICVKTVPLKFCKTFQPQNDRSSTTPHTKKYIFSVLKLHSRILFLSEKMNWQNMVKKEVVIYMFSWKHSYTEYLLKTHRSIP